MKKQSLYVAGASLVYFVAVLGVPVAVHAAPASPVIISELQPGTVTSASQEFIELLNISDKPVDLGDGHWQLIIASSSATSWANPYRTVDLSGVIEPGATYIIASTYTASGVTVHYLDTVAKASFAAGLAATAGHVRLQYNAYRPQADGECVQTADVADTLEWSTVTGGMPTSPSLNNGEVFPLSAKNGISTAVSLQRRYDNIGHTYQYSGSNATDFANGDPTPAALNIVDVYTDLAFEPLPGISVDTCTPVPSVPSSGTDPTEPPESSPSPSDDNTGGVSPDDGNGQDAEPPVDAGDLNSGLLPPSITELLPNPASPQTDADDEFIEIYNPNDAPYDVSGYIIEAGGATMRRYTVPAGMILGSYGYATFSAKVTGISLPNTAGSARLLHPDGTVAMEVAAYANAPDGQSWAYGAQGWQWTTVPTPGTINTIVVSAASVKKAATSTAKATPKKTTAVKTASTKALKTSTAKAKKTTVKKTPAKKAELSTVATSVRNPIHTGVLAAVGVFALLYGAYEYRHDLANKINQFRRNRATRRAHRQAAARR